MHFLLAIYTEKVLGQEPCCTRASFSTGYTVGTKKERKIEKGRKEERKKEFVSKFW